MLSHVAVGDCRSGCLAAQPVFWLSVSRACRGSLWVAAAAATPEPRTVPCPGRVWDTGFSPVTGRKAAMNTGSWPVTGRKAAVVCARQYCGPNVRRLRVPPEPRAGTELQTGLEHVNHAVNCYSHRTLPCSCLVPL